MTTLAEITLKVAQKVGEVLESDMQSGTTGSLTDAVMLIQNNQFWERGTVWFLSGGQAGKVRMVRRSSGNQLTFDPLSGVPCVAQVERAVVSGTVSVSGNAVVTVTAPGMANSPKAVNVAVVNGDTAAVVAGKIITALNADADVGGFFTASSVLSAVVDLTAKVATTNDTSINVAIANGTCAGLTASPTSTTITAGVRGRYAVARGLIPYYQLRLAVNAALENVKISAVDSSLTLDDEDLLTLPAGVRDVYQVEFAEADGTQPYPVTNYREQDGKLIFDRERTADMVRIFYRTTPAALSEDSDTLPDEINLTWLVWAAAANALRWAMRMYQADPVYKFGEFMNEALKNESQQRPLRGTRLKVRTA